MGADTRSSGPGDGVCPQPHSPWLMARCSLIPYPLLPGSSSGADLSHFMPRCMTTCQMGTAESARDSCLHVPAASRCRFHCRLRQSNAAGCFAVGNSSRCLGGGMFAWGFCKGSSFLSLKSVSVSYIASISLPSPSRCCKPSIPFLSPW